MIEILSLYNKIPFNEKKQFEKSVTNFDRQKGAFLLFDNEVQTNLFVIKSGIAFLYDDSGSNRRIIDIFYNNLFCADFISFTNQTKSKYCIECFSDCLVESIPYQDFLQALDQSNAIERAYRILLERMLAAALQQNLNEKTLTIEERFKLVMYQKPELFKLVPHKYIASYINIDVTNFSKLYNKYCMNNGLLYQ